MFTHKRRVSLIILKKCQNETIKFKIVAAGQCITLNTQY